MLSLLLLLFECSFFNWFGQSQENGIAHFCFDKVNLDLDIGITGVNVNHADVECDFYLFGSNLDSIYYLQGSLVKLIGCHSHRNK